MKKKKASIIQSAQEGSEAVKIMTGFTITEFLELYSLVEKSLKVTGKKPEIGPWILFSLLW